MMKRTEVALGGAARVPRPAIAELKMQYVSLFLFALIAAVNGRTLLTDEESPVIAAESEGRVESPDYKVINETHAYELREYANATWAVSFGRSRFLTDFAAIQAGIGLAKYFKGGNVEHKKIGKTIPIVGTILLPPPPPPKNHSQVELDHHKNGSHPGPPGRHHHHGPPGVALAAYIPKSFKGDAPLPESPHVKILHTNTSEVYVHSFGGWAISWFVGKEIGHLAHALVDQGICPFEGKFLVATYNSPWQFFDRHNEVWWVKYPKHHHNDSALIPTAVEATAGLEAFDAELLFPEEFAPEEAGAELQFGPEVEAANPATTVTTKLSEAKSIGANFVQAS